MISARMMYTSRPGNAADSTEIATYPTLTSVGSQPSHSARPPQTPAMTELLEERRNGLSSWVPTVRLRKDARAKARALPKKARSYYFQAMNKGTMTRQAILETALARSSEIGVTGLTIGGLAADLAMSKSGLYAHFGSKERLQLSVVDAAAELFRHRVVAPALAAPRGLPRIRRLFESWVAWELAKDVMPGGCFFVQASAELDGVTGEVRDRVAQLQREWFQWLAGAARLAVREGHFMPGVDSRQFAFELYGLFLAYHHAARLLNDSKAPSRLKAGFELLISRHTAADGAADG